MAKFVRVHHYHNPIVINLDNVTYIRDAGTGSVAFFTNVTYQMQNDPYSYYLDLDETADQILSLPTIA